MHNLNKQLDALEQKLDKVDLPIVKKSSSIGGDCFTASGVQFYLETNKPYTNAAEAKNDIVQRLAAVNIPEPVSQHSKYHLSTKSGDKSGQALIETSYNIADGGSYYFDLTLDENIKCETINRTYLCNDKKTTDLADELATNAKVVNTAVSVYLR